MAKNIRKAVLLLAMLSVIVGMFTACSNKKSDDGRTTFTVGFDAEFPPYGYKDDSGEYVGFDLDLAQEVCERNGWNLVKLLQHLQERMQQKKILHLRHNLRHFSRYLIIIQHL